jgi:hypothetical protein
VNLLKYLLQLKCANLLFDLAQIMAGVFFVDNKFFELFLIELHIKRDKLTSMSYHKDTVKSWVLASDIEHEFREMCPRLNSATINY